MRIVLVHGYKSSPQAAFWPWLKDELTRRGHEVMAPELPNPEEPVCQEWVDAINASIRDVHGDTVFIAHSLGCVALLHYFEQANMSGSPKSTILISPPFHIGAEKFATFFNPPVDFDTVAWKSQEFVVIHAKDDTVIPFEHSAKYERWLQAELKPIETGGHLMDAVELPIILDLIDDRNTEPGESLPDDFAEVEVVL